jgi:hypothetical protein
MSLPKLETPSYELTLPSDGSKVKYRPFLVKEYKILLTVLESDAEEIYRIVNELIDACTFKLLNVKKLPNFDTEYIFLNIRAKSIGENTSISLKCKNCEADVKADLDITKAEVERTEGHSNKIQINETLSIEMRYPTFQEILDIYGNSKSENIVDLICACIDKIYTEDQYFETSEYPKEEVVEFVNSFSKDQFDLLEKFFLTMPKLTQKVESICEKCNTTNEVKLEGLQNFFA